MSLEKLLVMEVAAELAAAVMSNLPDNLALDATIKDPNVRAANLTGWEEERLFYHGLIGALADDASWPPPPVGEKIQVLKIAAKLTAAVISNLPDTLALDPTIQDANLRIANLHAWETLRIYHHGLVGAMNDNASWPPPPDGLVNLSKILPSAALAASAAGPIPAAVSAAAAAIGKVAGM